MGNHLGVSSREGPFILFPTSLVPACKIGCHWFDKASEAVELAEKLQDEKIVNEDRIVDYQQHYIDMIYGRKNTGIILLS